jgi:hypothetical protein
MQSSLSFAHLPTFLYAFSYLPPVFIPINMKKRINIGKKESKAFRISG